MVHCWSRSGNYILHENHPLVLVSFSTAHPTSYLLIISIDFLHCSFGHRAMGLYSECVA